MNLVVTKQTIAVTATGLTVQLTVAPVLASRVITAGVQGLQGIQGPTGPMGSGVAWKGAYDAETVYELHDAVTYLGSSYACSVPCSGVLPTETSNWELVAAKGDTGAQGPKGDTGATGATGLTGPKGDTGATGADSTVAGPKGDTGATGAKGDKGDTGAQGIQGIQGIQGETGATGAAGAKGDKGDKGDTGDAFVYADFTAEQLAALTGPQGEQGPKGDTGDKGDPGTGIVWQGAWSSATAYVINDAVTDGGSSYVCILGHTAHEPPNGTYWTVMAAKGDTGSQGIQGAQGIQGETGAAGAKGDKGDTGAQGIQGIQGVKGDTGSQGIQGIQGETGLKGDTGAKGDTGSTGAKGDTGPGVAAGGTVGQVITKKSATDYDTEWSDANAGVLPLSGGTMTGTLIPAGHATPATAEVDAVCYGTGDPPAAGTVPEGTLWVKYTA